MNVQQRRSTQSISTVNTTSNLSASEQSRNRFTSSIDNSRSIVNLQSSHGVMKDGSHDSDVERSGVGSPVGVVEATHEKSTSTKSRTTGERH